MLHADADHRDLDNMFSPSKNVNITVDINPQGNVFYIWVGVEGSTVADAQVHEHALSPSQQRTLNSAAKERTMQL